MKFHRLPLLTALIGACFFVAACDRRDNAVTPPLPQTTTPSTTPTAPPGGTMPPVPLPGDTASMPGTGASR